MNAPELSSVVVAVAVAVVDGIVVRNLSGI